MPVQLMNNNKKTYIIQNTYLFFLEGSQANVVNNVPIKKKREQRSMINFNLIKLKKSILL